MMNSELYVGNANHKYILDHIIYDKLRNWSVVCFFSQMSSVGITENVKGDIKKFEIWYNGREEVYIVQVQDTIFFFINNINIFEYGMWGPNI